MARKLLPMSVKVDKKGFDGSMLNLRILLVLAVLCAGLGYAIFNQFPGLMLEAILAGCITFLILFSVLSVINAVSLKRRITSLETGLLEIETQINRRMNEISSNSVDKSDYELLRAQLSGQNNGHKPAKAGISPEGADNSPAQKKPARTKANISKLANGSVNGHAKQTASNIAPNDLTGGELGLHLQPIVDVASRSTFGFQVIPAFQNPQGKVSYVDYSKDAELPGTLWNPRFDLQIFSKSMLLVRKLRQKAPDVLVFIPFSGSIFSDKRQFKQLKQEIDANKALAKHCVLCIDAGMWQQIDKSRRSYLVDLLDYGFQTAIMNCQDPSSLKKSVKLDQFSFYFASVNDLGIDASDQPNGSAAVLQKLSDEHDFSIIVASVDHDYELIRLVDENFSFAIGEYLSPAKAPNL